MSEVVVLEAVRTPRGKARPGGGLASRTPLELVTLLLDALAERTGLDPALVGDVVLGCASQAGEQGGNLARTAVLAAGWGDHLPGVTVNRFCASGLDAVNTAAARIAAGAESLLVAGGVESVSRVPMFSDGGPMWSDPGLGERIGSVHMGVAADLVATLEGFERPELDGYGALTQERAAAAWDAGRYARAVVAVEGVNGAVCTRDEALRGPADPAALAALEPSFAGLGAAGQDALALARYPRLAEVRHLHTRATSPSLADAACLVLLGSPEAAARLGLRPRARIVAQAVRAVDPVIMLTAGQDAAIAAMKSAGWSAGQVELVEYAEAFAALCLKFQRDTGIGADRFNVNGGTIAMGHAFGATGAILLTGLVDELERSGRTRGVAAVSGAAGLGVATAVERV
jgi:acetyl-CoA C-acetyltransferase